MKYKKAAQKVLPTKQTKQKYLKKQNTSNLKNYPSSNYP